MRTKNAIAARKRNAAQDPLGNSRRASNARAVLEWSKMLESVLPAFDNDFQRRWDRVKGMLNFSQIPYMLEYGPYVPPTEIDDVVGCFVCFKVGAVEGARIYVYCSTFNTPGYVEVLIPDREPLKLGNMDWAAVKDLQTWIKEGA